MTDQKTIELGNELKRLQDEQNSDLEKEPNSGWRHPTGNNPKIVNIIALGPTNTDYLADQHSYEPVIPKADELWTLNKAFRTLKADLVFVLDDIVGEHAISSRYIEDMHYYCDAPVMTTIVDFEVNRLLPSTDLGRYPIENVIDFWGLQWLTKRTIEERRAVLLRESGEALAAVEQIGPHIYPGIEVRLAGKRVASYMKNSIPMILAYAGYIGVRTIHMFGADFDFPGQALHEERKPNAEYWCAMLYGIGCELRMSARTTLLCTNEGRELYGYGKRQPRL